MELGGEDLQPRPHPCQPTSALLPSRQAPAFQARNLCPHSQTVFLTFAEIGNPITYSRLPPCSPASESPGEGGKTTGRAGPSKELSQMASRHRSRALA